MEGKEEKRVRWIAAQKERVGKLKSEELEEARTKRPNIHGLLRVILGRECER